MYSDKDYFLRKIDLAELNKLTASNDDNLTKAIEAADSLIDSYLANTVAVLPLVSVPGIIMQLSYDIAIFYLHDRIQYNDIPERVKSKYDAAVFFLKDIARGQANIVGLAADNISETVLYDSNSNVYNRGVY